MSSKMLNTRANCPEMTLCGNVTRGFFHIYTVTVHLTLAKNELNVANSKVQKRSILRSDGTYFVRKTYHTWMR